jgi:hypothetical protein
LLELKNVKLEVEASPAEWQPLSINETRRYSEIHRHNRALFGINGVPDPLSLP